MFIHSSVGGLLGCFYLLPIMNNAGLNIHMQVFMWTYVFISLGYIPTSRKRICSLLYLTFPGTARLFSKVAAAVYNPISNVYDFQFLHVVICLFYFSHPSWCEMVLIHTSLMANVAEHLFMCLFTKPFFLGLLKNPFLREN